MIDIIRDWFGLAVGLVSLCLQLRSTPPGPRQRTRVRRRDLKLGGWLRWTSYDRDDTRS